MSVKSGGRGKRKGEKGGKIKRSGLQDIYMVEARLKAAEKVEG